MAVCSFANQSYRYDSAYPSTYSENPDKGVIHTTETTTRPGYDGGSMAPHFTVLPNMRTKTVTVYQHFNTSRPSRALVNKSGGVQTNREGTIQIELVGTSSASYAAKYGGIHWPTAPQWALDGLKKLMRWIEANHAVPRKSTSRPWLAYGRDTRRPGVTPASYGKSPARMSFTEWINFKGWCGHQHVPENDHGDPGNIDITYLLSAKSTRTIVVKAATTIAALAASLGISVAALTSANPQLPSSPTATASTGVTVTIPPNAPVVPAPPTKTPPPATKPSPPKAQAPARRPVLRRGSTGAAVKTVQRIVGVTADGSFGPGTQRAAIAFQRSRGLARDGVVGPKTWASLTKQPQVRRGSKGATVRIAQRFLGITADGSFGPGTQRAATGYQGKHRLVKDGVVGPKTWASLTR